MSSIKKDFHLGIYGLIEKGNEILLIRKSRGPYKGLFDLPGGRPSHGEALLEALTREIQEETGIEAKNFTFLGNFSFLTLYQDAENNQRELYHIALTYYVNQMDVKNFNASIIEEDVNGSLWMDKRAIQKEECSPLLRTILESYETT